MINHLHFIPVSVSTGEDTVAGYWQSEHHQVEFSRLRQFVGDMDPNSLHQVAIALPGNYVNRRMYIACPSFEYRIINILLFVPIMYVYTEQLSSEARSDQE